LSLRAPQARSNLLNQKIASSPLRAPRNDIYESADKREETLQRTLQALKTPHKGEILAIDMRSHAARGWGEHDSRPFFIKKSVLKKVTVQLAEEMIRSFEAGCT
jgi:hypothetical protein